MTELQGQAERTESVQPGTKKSQGDMTIVFKILQKSKHTLITVQKPGPGDTAGNKVGDSV